MKKHVSSKLSIEDIKSHAITQDDIKSEFFLNFKNNTKFIVAIILFLFLLYSCYIILIYLDYTAKEKLIEDFFKLTSFIFTLMFGWLFGKK